jgi:hypothetical protein
MKRNRPMVLVFIWIAGLVLAACSSVEAARDKDFEIQPGPTRMSPAELELSADPSRGIEHAVIILEETDQDDAIGILNRSRYHLRAKILSNLGRGLANVEIPLFAKEGSVKKWWGRTILPDGTVLEIKKRDLKKTSRIRSGRKREYTIVKAILPGVVPGAVIDYGYEVRDLNDAFWRKLPLQRKWFMKEFRYRWIPLPITFAGQPLMSATNILRGEGLDITPAQVRNSFTVVAKNLPPIVEEPWMPPTEEVRAAAIFYYTLLSGSRTEFWDAYARQTDSTASAVMPTGSALHRLVESIGIPPEASLETKLRIAYDWIGAKIVNTSLLSADQLEESTSDRDEKTSEPQRIARIMERRRGSAEDLDHLFLGMARSLGAEAHLARAADRTTHHWNPELLAWWGQFDETLVAVRQRGEPASRTTLVDAGSGLPYGEIPWWVSGTRGLLATQEGAREILIKSAGSRSAVSETSARIGFSRSNAALIASWTVTGKGQHGLSERRELRELSHVQRSGRLAELCGAGDDLDLIYARAPGVMDLHADFKLECEGELSEAIPTSESSEYLLPFMGRWIQEVPVLIARDRVHPIVFPFPRLDLATVDIDAPPGFIAGEPPEPVQLAGPFGNYFLQISRTESGFKVQRRLTLPHQQLHRNRYEGFKRFLSQVHRADRANLKFSRIKENDLERKKP